MPWKNVTAKYIAHSTQTNTVPQRTQRPNPEVSEYAGA